MDNKWDITPFCKRISQEVQKSNLILALVGTATIFIYSIYYRHRLYIGQPGVEIVVIEVENWGE
jgi:hypothetical protein